MSNPYDKARKRIDRGEHPDCPNCGIQMTLKTKPHYDSDQVYHPPEWVCPECGRIEKEGEW